MPVKQSQSQKVIVNIHPEKKVKKKKKKRKSGRGTAPSASGSYYRPPTQAPALAPVIHSPQVDLDKYRTANLLSDVTGHIKVLQQRMDNPSAQLGNNPLGHAAAVRRATAVPEASAPASAPASEEPASAPPALPKKKKREAPPPALDPVYESFASVQPVQPAILEPTRDPTPQMQTAVEEPKPEVQTTPTRRKVQSNLGGTEEGRMEAIEKQKKKISEKAKEKRDEGRERRRLTKESDYDRQQALELTAVVSEQKAMLDFPQRVLVRTGDAVGSDPRATVRKGRGYNDSGSDSEQ